MNTKKYLNDYFSIIIPVYNTPIDVLKRCFISVINQTYKKIQILIINDGSERAIANYCTEFFEDIPMTKVINQSNQGVSVARNIGIENACGEYIAFVDSDDYITTDYIENFYNVFKKKNVDVVFTNTNKFNENYSIKQDYLKCNSHEILLSNKKNKDFSPYELDLIGRVWARAYSKKSIGNNKFNPNLKIGEDIEFNIRLFENNLSYAYINTYGYKYYENEFSTIRKFDLKRINWYEKSLIQIKKTINNNITLEKKQMYFMWGCTYYRVIMTNYIFSEQNDMDINNKISFLIELKNKSVYRECFENVELRRFKFSRRVPIILIKKNQFWLIYILIKYYLKKRRKK